ncbi:MAG: radical SAM protein [archaeon]
MKETIKITKESGIPLMGVIPFGIIDRGSSLIQIRPNTNCNLKCVFCSTSANDSNIHPFNYEIEYSYLLEWVKQVVEFKNIDVEANLDSCGEITLYKDLVKLVKGLKDIKQINKISMQTNGLLLNESFIKELEKAGLDRINLSIHSLNKETASKLACISYNLKHIINIINLIKNLKISLCLTPVYIPGYEQDIIDLIKFSKQNNTEIAIQKYETYKYSRRLKVKEQTFYNFYKKLTAWEREFGIKLKYGPRDFNIIRTKKLPLIFKKGDKIQAKIVLPGWYKNQMIAYCKNRLITIINCNKNINDTVKAEILDTKNELYIAK